MNTWTKISWQRMKKSSKAALIPNKNEAMPIKRPRIAAPLKRLKRFRKFDLWPTASVATFTYFVIETLTAVWLMRLYCPAPDSK